MASAARVGLPIDLLVYREGTLASEDIVCIEESNAYFNMIRNTWGQRLREVFENIDDPEWGPNDSRHPLRTNSDRYDPLRKITHPSEKIV